MLTGQQAAQTNLVTALPDGPATAVNPVAVFQEAQIRVGVETVNVDGNFTIVDGDRV